MAESSQAATGGGFVRMPPSPAPSSTSTTRSIASLPHPRGRPLVPGSAKEDKVRRYVEGQLLYISRRYIKKFAIENPDDTVHGYKSMAELCKDVEGLINILWLSATPSLQIPYLLNIAGEFDEWLTHFPPSPNATFSLLRKLDHCFASLLLGKDIDTRESLPGFEVASQGGMTATDKVRCRSIVEQTRVEIVNVMSNAQQGGDDEEDQEEDEDDDMDGDYVTPTETDRESEAEGSVAPSSMYGEGEDDDDDRLAMDVAKVYENTLVQLGESI
ncbi:meiotic recombination protein DMC1 [Coniochaeta sp. 2T2.1]|nr:meiotic recombination protein DMC1 [Coniochaeta sp. 2T2.1]